MKIDLDKIRATTEKARNPETKEILIPLPRETDALPWELKEKEDDLIVYALALGEHVDEKTGEVFAAHAFFGARKPKEMISREAWTFFARVDLSRETETLDGGKSQLVRHTFKKDGVGSVSIYRQLVSSFAGQDVAVAHVDLAGQLGIQKVLKKIVSAGILQVVQVACQMKHVGKGEYSGSIPADNDDPQSDRIKISHRGHEYWLTDKPEFKFSRPNQLGEFIQARMAGTK